MSTALLNKAGKKLFERHMEQYAPVDPMYEHYTDPSGKKKRRRREIPPGLSARDAKILKSVQRRAHYLDKGFQFGPVRFGWTFFIGLIPAVGDVVDALLNYLLVVRKCRQADIPPWLLTRMLTNNSISALVGLIPFAGDVVLAAFKANSRNAALLEEFLRIRGEELLRMQAGGPSSVPPADAAQVKPGAGLAPGEPLAGGTSKGAQLVIPGALPARPDATTPSANSSGKTSGRSRLSFSGWRSKSTSEKGKAAQAGERGRFIEDVGASDNNAIKKK